jgi:N-glycosidase YbiA
MTIYFYTPRDKYGCFSNFSPHGIELDGRYWPTVEHYFQAQKFTDKVQRERIASARTPKDAKTLGWDRKLAVRPGWDQIKDDVMLRAVRKKFATHERIRAILLATGDEALVENAPSDSYWGCGADGSGKNRLGEILMQVRAELRAG